MLSKRSSPDVAEVARRRLSLLSAELAALRAERPSPAADTTGEEAPDVPFDGPGAWSAPDADGEDEDPVLVALTTPRARSVSPRARPAEATPPAPPPSPSGTPGKHARRAGSRTLPPRTTRLSGVTDWLHDRLPATLQGRVQLGTGHLVVVSAVVVAALVVTAWWVARADGGSRPVAGAAPTRASSPAALVTPTTGATGTVAGNPGVPVATGTDAAPLAAAPGSVVPGATSAGASDAAGTVVVDVAGKVRRPGIATLPAGSRVADALDAAGGARRGVGLRSLNLARVLADGEQILVGVRPVPGVAAAAAPVSGLVGGATSASGTTPGLMVNVNTADQAALEELPGVGPVTAQAIMSYRTEQGAFTAVDQLMEVSGIGEVTLAEMVPFVTV